MEEQLRRQEEDRQRGIVAENQAREAQAFETAMRLRDEQLAAAATRQKPMPMPEFTVDPQTQALIPKPETLAPTETAPIAIPEHLRTPGGPEQVGARPIEYLGDVQEKQAQAALKAAETQRGIEEELGDRITVTEEMVKSLPEGIQHMYSDMIGQTVPRAEIGGVAMQVWGTKERERQRLDAEERQKQWQVETEGRRAAEWDRQFRARVNEKGLGAQLTPDQITRLSQSTVAKGDWRSFTADHLVRENFGKRSGLRQSDAIMWSNELGIALPPKKVAEQTLAAKEALADINEIQDLMKDKEVKEWLGAYAGRIVDWTAPGWADPLRGILGKPDIPPDVWKFRAALNRLGAEERHKIFGAAVTQTEIPFARSFIPAMTQSIDALEAAVDEAEDSIVRGLNAIWGADAGMGAPGATGEATPDANDPLGIR
jgi:hypothetical protein